MATSIFLVCPECGKQVKAPDNVLGKKVRCKFCQAAFVAQKGTDTKAPSKPGKPTPTGPSPSPPKKGGGGGGPAGKPAPAAKPADDDEVDEKPYTLVDISLAPRCPDCANEMEEGQIICLICGYNTRTRIRAKTVKVYHQTFWDYLIWLSPGIACALVVLSIIGFNVWYLLRIDKIVGKDDSWYLMMWTVSGIKLWVVIMSIGVTWVAGKYAFKRLVLHPKPPEIEKLK